MITLKDFAKQNGVTERTIQRHLKKHEAALLGHFERRKGNNGTLLDDYACDYIKEHITEKTVLVESPQGKMLIELLQERDRLKDQLHDTEKQLQDLQTDFKLLEGTRAQLQAKNEEKEEKIEALTEETKAQTVKIAEISALSAEKDKSIENLEKELEKARDEAREAHLEAQFYENLGFWGKITNKKYKKQD